MSRSIVIAALLPYLASSQPGPPGPELDDKLRQALEKASKRANEEYNCSISLALKGNRSEVSAASGIVDFSSGRRAQVEDKYVWGSGTKPLTGASILRLASEGVFNLTDKVATLLDPVLAKMAESNPQQNFTCLADLWNESYINKVSIHGLLHMSTGIPDFDTAWPCYTVNCTASDSLRMELYENSQHSYSPIELMNKPWVRGHWTSSKHGKYRYSSTNYMLLGLLMTAHSNAASWDAFDQASFLPPPLRDELQFSTSLPPSAYTEVHGYDRTIYNMPAGQHNDHDNSNVAGVFSGFTASDMVATVPSVARLAWEIYREQSIASPEYSSMMTNWSSKTRYGYATQLNRNHSGQSPGKYGLEYGHFGATYGYQSFLMYYPELDIALAGASNMESDHEDQVKAALCYAYNEVAAVLLGKADMHCSFSCTTSSCSCECTRLEPEPTTTTSQTTPTTTASATTTTTTSQTTVTTGTMAASIIV